MQRKQYTCNDVIYILINIIVAFNSFYWEINMEVFFSLSLDKFVYLYTYYPYNALHIAHNLIIHDIIMHISMLDKSNSNYGLIPSIYFCKGVV